MSKKTTTIDAAAITATLTSKGREFMRAVGAGEFSFFDGGIADGEGCWGSVLSGEGFTSVRSASGIMGATAKAGLWDVNTEQDPTGPDAGAWWSLTAEGAAVALYLAGEQAESAALPAEEPVTADSPAAQPEKVADAVRDWRGNYNTVFAPAAEMIAAGVDGIHAWTVGVSAMLKQTHPAGPGAAGIVASLGETEVQAVAALKTWQKTLDRKDATDMEKFNENRSFLSGYLGAVVQEVTGARKTPVVALGKDMDRALRPEALKAGAATRKTEATA